MEQRNNKRKSIILEIDNLLNKMSNQVNFLIRKEMMMNQLDIDILMENTRKLYDTLCSVELGVRNEEFEVENETAFGEDEKQYYDRDEVEVKSVVEEEIDSESDEIIDEEDERADMVWDFTTENESEISNEELVVEDDDDIDEMENLDEEEKESVDEDVEIDMDEDPETEENHYDVKDDYEDKSDEDSGIRAYRKINNEYFTLGDKLEQTVDNSLVARLQRKPVTDLMTAIGINDKFLFLNELFGGSMEKYNKSIRALNNFSTLLGARTYMSELQIEFQWDSDSDAYKKLADLIERKFI